MGISFKIDAGEGIVYAMAEGTIGAADILAYRINLRADPIYRPEFGVIVESRISSFRLSDKETKILASNLPADHPRKLAIVAVGPNRNWALRYKEVSVDKPVEVFADLGSAMKWVASD